MKWEPLGSLSTLPSAASLAVYHSYNLVRPHAVQFVEINGDARAYPLMILTWHEIINDVVGGVPIVITFCPLCNTGIVFKSTLEGHVLNFGTTGYLRFSNLIMFVRA